MTSNFDFTVNHGIISVLRHTKRGAFCVFNTVEYRNIHCGQSAPYQRDSRSAVCLSNDGKSDKGRFVMNRKAVGVTGKLWRKVTPREKKEWQDLFDKGWTLREIGRKYGRQHKVISNHININQEKLKQNKTRAMSHDNRSNSGRKKMPVTFEMLLRDKLVRALQMARRRSENKKVDIDINYHYVRSLYDSQCGKCLLTDIPFTVSKRDKDSVHRTNPYTPSIDRIDSVKGYTKDNIRLVIWGLNWAIGEWGEETYREIALAYLSRKGGCP